MYKQIISTKLPDDGPPEIFNEAHIRFVQTWQRITAGEEPFAEYDFDPGFNSVTIYLQCPKCKHYQSLKINIEKEVSFISCESCRQQFIAAGGGIYFKSQTPADV